MLSVILLVFSRITDNRKIIIRLNLTSFLLLMVILQVSANSMAQKITLSLKNAPLMKVFDQISQQSGYDFLVSTENLKAAKPVSITVKDEDLEEVLEKLFNISL
ncbi:hypothetical protein [Mucilaginibacter paludis]|nr:hypothetical protein [Mucilaginibacter paludis]